MTDFSNSRAALKIYDALKPEREAAYEAAETLEGVEAWQDLEYEHLQSLRAAFYEDTKAFNSRRDVMNHVDVAFIRKCCAG